MSFCFCTGTYLYTLNGSDPEGEPVTYGMTFDKGYKEYFSVEPKSGHVTLIESLDREVCVYYLKAALHYFCIYSISPSLFNSKGMQL